MTAGEPRPETLSKRKLLIIDDDRDIADLVHAILTDEGYIVSVLHDQDANAIRTAINLLEPDCVLLDGKDPREYGEAWDDANSARASFPTKILYAASFGVTVTS